MKNLTKKGFTLVELIVVITILAILGTIAFISLQGESQNAKNSKVVSDLRTMVTAIEVGSTKGNFGLADIVTGDRSATNGVDTTGTITIKTSTGANTQAAISTVTYDIGTLDFAKIGQNGDDFKDPEDKDYVVSYAGSGQVSYYQLAGQTKNADSTYTAVIKGNYVAQTGDSASLVSDNQSNAAITNGENIGAGLY